MRLFLLLPDDLLADAEHGAAHYQSGGLFKLGCHLNADAAVGVINLGVAPVLLLGIVFQAAEYNDLIHRCVAERLVGILGVGLYGAVWVVKVGGPADSAFESAVGKLDDFYAVGIVAGAAEICAHYVVGLIVLCQSSKGDEKRAKRE